ncbi:MAG: FHA domain-containing protein [Eubacteriales bacterium]|nr:FHA domain-containing protein [Eubacteriales bacterium]
MRRKEKREKDMGGKTAGCREIKVLLLLFLISFCGQTVQAESEEKHSIFYLYCIKDEDTSVTLSATKIKDLETGCFWLVSCDMAGVLEEGGYDLYLLQGDFQEKVTVAGNQSGLSFLSAAETGDYPSVGADRSSAPDMDMAQILVYYQKGVYEYEADIESWQKNDLGRYDSGTQLEDFWICGSPVVHKENSHVMGILSADLYNYSLEMIDLSQTELNPEWALGNTAQIPEESGGDTGRDKSTLDASTWIMMVIYFIVAFAALYLSMKMRKKRIQALKAYAEQKQEKRRKAKLKKNDTALEMQSKKQSQPSVRQIEDPDKTKPAEGGEDRTKPVGDIPQYCLIGIEGVMKGRAYDIRGICWIGRSVDCQISYPDDTRGVSGRHCEVIPEKGKLLLMDVGSTCGTYMGDGVKLAANEPYELKEGDIFYLADRNHMFLVSRKG